MNTILVVLILYLLFIFGLAWWLSRQETLSSYFLNRNNTGVWLFTFSNIATVLGAGATTAIVAEVYRTGISYGLALPISFIIGMIIMGFVAKKIREFGGKQNAHTIVDFFGYRFDEKNRVLAGILQIFLLTIWTAAQAVAIGSLASVVTGISYTFSLIIAAAITVLYTAVGGLKIDLITDFIQFWVIFGMFSILAAIGYFEVGGVSNLFAQLPRGHLDPFAFGGIEWFVGIILLSGFIYMGNSGHWQRIFSTQDAKTAQKGFFWTLPFLTILSTLVLFIGFVSVVVLPSGVKGEKALFKLMETTLPSWLVGVGFASILSVIMSSIDSLLVAGSTILYRAVYGEEKGSDTNNVLYARGVTAVFGAFGFTLAFLVPNIVTLSLLNTYLVLNFVPPIFAGLYSNISADASFWAILISSVVLFVLFPILGKDTFIINVPLCIFLTIGYDSFIEPYLPKRLKS